MGWAKLDDRAPQHPKLLDAGAEAAWLWAAALCYCNGYHTGGVIEKKHLPAVYSRFSSSKARKLAERLVDVGLWHDEGDRYVVHDFEDHNPVGDELVKVRALKTARQRKWRQKRLLGTGVDASTSVYKETPKKASTGTRLQASTETRHRARDPVPSRPVPSREDLPLKGGASSARAREAPPPTESFGIERIAEIFDEERRAAKGARYLRFSGDEERLTALATWAERTAEDLRTTPDEVVRRSVRGYVRDEKARSKGFPLAFWASDPGSYLGVNEQHETEQRSGEYQRLRDMREEAFKRGDIKQHDDLQREIDELFRTA